MSFVPKEAARAPRSLPPQLGECLPEAFETYQNPRRWGRRKCCQFSIGARRERTAWKAAFPASGRAAARPSHAGVGRGVPPSRGRRWNAVATVRLAEDGSPHQRGRSRGGRRCGPPRAFAACPLHPSGGNADRSVDKAPNQLTRAPFP